jgi:hypothetical protein
LWRSDGELTIVGKLKAIWLKWWLVWTFKSIMVWWPGRVWCLGLLEETIYWWTIIDKAHYVKPHRLYTYSVRLDVMAAVTPT